MMDVRWVCWDCKTVYFGEKDFLSDKFKQSLSNSRKDIHSRAIERLSNIRIDLETILGKDTSPEILELIRGLEEWLMKHEGHKISLTNSHRFDWEVYESEMNMEIHENRKLIENNTNKR